MVLWQDEAVDATNIPASQSLNVDSACTVGLLQTDMFLERLQPGRRRALGTCAVELGRRRLWQRGGLCGFAPHQRAIEPRIAARSLQALRRRVPILALRNGEVFPNGPGGPGGQGLPGLPRRASPRHGRPLRHIKQDTASTTSEDSLRLTQCIMRTRGPSEAQIR